jgi:replicative DNA helicase
MVGAISQAEADTARQGALSGIATGLRDLDSDFDALRPGKLTLLAGRPNMGTTWLAINIAFNVARSGIPVALFSMDLTAEDVAARVASIHTAVDMFRLCDGHPEPAQVEAIRAAAKATSDVPLFIDDTRDISVQELAARARSRMQAGELGMIVVDELQMMRRTGHMTAAGLPDYTYITRPLKALAVELDIPVVLTSRVWASACDRDGSIPNLLDLIPYGNIEYDADVLGFVYREEYYHVRMEPDRVPGEDDGEFAARYAEWEERLALVLNSTSLRVARHYRGRIGAVTLGFDDDTGAYSDFVYGSEEE